MFFTGATVAGDPAIPNEDWTAATPDLVVMLDGVTVRTETGCRHGAAWYTRKLGAAILANAAVRSTSLARVLSEAIREVAGLHSECDLTHPGTPSAAVAIVRLDGERLRYIVLGDVTVVLDTTTDGIVTISDHRIGASAAAQRAKVDRYLIGSTEKSAALVAMKHAELAARNQPDGYWIAAADPSAPAHAITGETTIDTVQRIAVLTDGAARWVELFRLGGWSTALDAIAKHGPRAFVQRIRRAEGSDPVGAVYRRNKVSDDATVVYAESPAFAVFNKASEPSRPTLTRDTQLRIASELTSRMNDPRIYGDGQLRKSDPVGIKVSQFD